MRGVPLSPESIVNNILIDANNGVVFNAALYQYEITALIRMKNDELLSALQLAREVIENWNTRVGQLGLLSVEEIVSMWALYQTSPEMRKINTAILNAIQ